MILPAVDPNARYLAERAVRTEAEAARLDAVRARGIVPEACGPEIPMAPARGAMKSFRPIELVPGTVGLARDVGHWERGEDCRRRAGCIKDVFDRMDDRARVHRLDQPLTPAQVQVGRDYRDLTERHAAGGVRCASLEAAGRGSGGHGGEFIDAFVAEGLRIEALQRRIGHGIAMAIRRIRPSLRGAKSVISDRRLVDMVCLQDCDLGQVLEAHGWAAKGDSRAALRTALAAALDRMQGYDLHKAQNRVLTLKSG